MRMLKKKKQKHTVKTKTQFREAKRKLVLSLDSNYDREKIPLTQVFSVSKKVIDPKKTI